MYLNIHYSWTHHHLNEWHIHSNSISIGRGEASYTYCPKLTLMKALDNTIVNLVSSSFTWVTLMKAFNICFWICDWARDVLKKFWMTSSAVKSMLADWSILSDWEGLWVTLIGEVGKGSSPPDCSTEFKIIVQIYNFKWRVSRSYIQMHDNGDQLRDFQCEIHLEGDISSH